MILVVSALKNEQIQIANSISILTGVGLVNAAVLTAKAICENDIDLVINVGTVGAINEEIGSVHRVKSVINADYDLTKFKLDKYTTLGADFKKENAIQICEEGLTLASSNAFAQKIIDGISLYDMEAYSIAKVCQTFGKKLIIVKGVSDLIGQNVNLKEYKEVLKNLNVKIKEEVLLALSEVIE